MENENPKISVIVPVYKAEKYLHKCVDSLLSQTFRDFEVLLVDDGSPDRSGEICDEYARKDNRVRVFHKENGGVSSARQCGLDNARGEYTIHADPDDWVEPNMLEELYRKAKAENADVIVCDYYYEYGNKTIVHKQSFGTTSGKDLIIHIFQMNVSASLWNKLIRKDCIEKAHSAFPKDINIGEDYCFLVSTLMCAEKVVYIGSLFYHYVRNEQSLTKSKNYQLLLQRLAFVEIIEKRILEEERLKENLPYLKLMVKCDVLTGHHLTAQQYHNLYPEVNNYILKSNYSWALKICLLCSLCNYNLGYHLFRTAQLFAKYLYNDGKCVVVFFSFLYSIQSKNEIFSILLTQ